MKTEYITIRDRETTLRIMNTEIEAVRKKDIVRKGVRVIKENVIGVSGSIGEVPNEELIDQAEQNLSMGIRYPYELAKNIKRHEDYGEKSLQKDNWISQIEVVLETLKREYPEFDFSEKVGVNNRAVSYENTEGLELEYRDTYMDLEFVLKEKSSVNLFDGFLLYTGRSFDEGLFLDFNRNLLKAHMTPVELPDGHSLPVFMFNTERLDGYLGKALSGENYAVGSSIFKGKMNQKLFDSKVTYCQNFDGREVYRPFFDMEGTLLKGDKLPLIENGELVNVFTDKKTAECYGLPHVGGATGDYDGMPRLENTTIKAEVDSSAIKDVLKGELAVLVFMAEGGDFTSDGGYATPVQLSYLFDGDRILGKLPEFSVSSNLYKMLGEDYLGTFRNPFYMGENSTLQGYRLKVNR